MLFIHKHPQYVNQTAFESKTDKLSATLLYLGFLCYQIFKVLLSHSHRARRVTPASLLMTHTYSSIRKK